MSGQHCSPSKCGGMRDTAGEILPVPPLIKEGTQKPPFVKGAARSAGGFGNGAVMKRTFASRIMRDDARVPQQTYWRCASHQQSPFLSVTSGLNASRLITESRYLRKLFYRG